MANAVRGGLPTELGSMTEVERELARKSVQTLLPFLKCEVVPALKVEADGELREVRIPAPAFDDGPELLGRDRDAAAGAAERA